MIEGIWVSKHFKIFSTFASSLKRANRRQVVLEPASPHLFPGMYLWIPEELKTVMFPGSIHQGQLD
jgi:hypothetical protein